MSIVLVGSTSGSITLQEPAVAGTTTINLPATSGTAVVGSSAVSATGQIPFSTDGSTYTPTAKIVSGTAVASTSGTSIDFTGIPSWVKRITVMFNGVSTNGTSSFLVQIGSGSFTSSGYNSCSAGCINAAPPAVSVSTAGYLIIADTASDVRSGHMVITLLGSNTYVSSHTLGGDSTRDVCWWGGGSVALGGALDRVRITTVSLDTFDAGTINILYE